MKRARIVVKAFKNRLVFVGMVALLGVALVGCQSPQPKHRMTEAGTGTKIACRMCYDEAVRVLTGPPRHRRYKTALKHKCPDCFSDVEVYEDGGTPMIKCARCAPDGVACNECLPPDGAAK
jgi:hypothetical protein